jgi:hypothetical protein
VEDQDLARVGGVRTERSNIQPAIGAEYQALRPVEMHSTTPVLITGKNVEKAPVFGVEAQNIPYELVELVSCGKVTDDRHIDQAIRTEDEPAGIKLPVEASGI